MNNNRLQITAVEHSQRSSPSPIVSRGARRQEVQATMERLWLENPEQFNAERDAVQRKRLSATLSAIQQHLPLKDKHAADLGCGGGTLSRMLRNEGAIIDAVDIAGQALHALKAHDMHQITPIQDCLPTTRLEDQTYDVVVCTEVIGYLNPKEYRMLFAELSRLVKADGITACSTSLDINSDYALEHFAAIAETEFNIEQWILRYDLLWIKWCNFFEAPQRYLFSSQNPHARTKELNKRKHFSKFWYQLNTTKPAAFFWKLINAAAKPIAFYLRQHEGIINFFERITKLIWDESGVSHALFIGKRRPMVFPLPPNEVPVERKHKREVWD